MRRSPPTWPRRSPRRRARRPKRSPEAQPERARPRSVRGGRKPAGARVAHCYPRPSEVARTRDIRTNQLDVACDVCGRTLLRGEHAEHYLAGGERRVVCDLCIARAQHEGWIRESGADDLELRHPRHEGRSFMDRLRAGRRQRVEVSGDELSHEEPAPPPIPRREQRERERERERETPPPEPRREQRHIRAVPTNAELKMQRAL